MLGYTVPFQTPEVKAGAVSAWGNRVREAAGDVRAQPPGRQKPGMLIKASVSILKHVSYVRTLALYMPSQIPTATPGMHVSYPNLVYGRKLGEVR